MSDYKHKHEVVVRCRHRKEDSLRVYGHPLGGEAASYVLVLRGEKDGKKDVETGCVFLTRLSAEKVLESLAKSLGYDIVKMED